MVLQKGRGRLLKGVRIFIEWLRLIEPLPTSDGERLNIISSNAVVKSPIATGLKVKDRGMPRSFPLDRIRNMAIHREDTISYWPYL